MLKSIIDYADVFIKPLGFRVKGLAERLENDGQTLPAVYIGSGQYEFVNPEETLVYHRVLSGPSKSVEEGPIYDDEIQTLTWSMRAVAIFDFNLYCDDSYSLEDTVIRNLMAAFKDASTGTLGKELGLSELDYEPDSSDRGRSAWEDEFSTSYTGQRKIVSVDYDLTLTGFESCFTALGCGDDEIDIASLIISEYCTSDLCADGTITLNGVTFGTVVSGGTFVGLVQYVNGTPVGSDVSGVWTIPNPITCDPVTVNVNGTLYDSPASGATLDIPVIDGDGASVGTVNAGTSVVIADSAISINSTSFADLPAEDALDIPVEYENGTPVGSDVAGVWTIPNPITCADATITVNSQAYSSVASGGSDDIPVVNSAATQIGTVTPGGNVTIGNMTIDYPDATTQALVIVPGSTVTIPPHWTVQLTGTVASHFTVVSPAWDSSFVCATEALTGGTISSITINGGAPIATFVGASIPASATIVVTFASSLTQIVLTF